MEVKHRCNQILELGFPLGGLAKLFAQDWEGDVTVVMPATLAQVHEKVYNFSLSYTLSIKSQRGYDRNMNWASLQRLAQFRSLAFLFFLFFEHSEILPCCSY